MIDRLRQRLGRLRVAQRLALLVLVPLTAVVGLAIPVVVDRTSQASAAATIADEASTRRVVGVLLEELQRERLLSLLYLSQPTAESLPVVRQSQSVNDAIETVRQSADTNLGGGLAALQELLDRTRPRVLERSVLGLVVHTLYSQGISTMLDGMPPPHAAGVTASVAPAAALDELLRANEQAARFGAAVLLISTESSAKGILDDSRTSLALYTTRFTHLAEGEHRNLLTQAENSQSARRVIELAEAVDVGDTSVTGDVNVLVGRIAAAVETYTTLRRLVGDRIAREIVDDAEAGADAAQREAVVVAILGFLLLILVAGLAAAGARSIALPLAQLNAAAIAVAAATGRELERVSDVETQAEAAPTLRAVPTTGPGEVADLAAAFNRVQEGAAGLLARQVTTRRNVAAMFATVARRTRNLADRQLNLIDVLERQQQDPQLLERLYRLDHVATRLRRSASALLVVSGAADDPTGNPMRMADVVRAAAAEIEQFTRVQLVDAVDVAAVPRAVPDLILLVAELLDNAVSYSPPPAPVEVRVGFGANGSCRISISDVGIGMSADQLASENQRLVDRERLDIVPTQVLGLFVVGRLARRHGLTVMLSPNQPQGIAVIIDLPARLLTSAVGPTATAPQPRGMRQAVRRTTRVTPVPEKTVAAMTAAAENQDFDWFGDGRPMLPAGAQPAALPSAGAPPVPEPLVRPAVALPGRVPAGPAVPSAGGPAAPAAFGGGPATPAAFPTGPAAPTGPAVPAGPARIGSPAAQPPAAYPAPPAVRPAASTAPSAAAASASANAAASAAAASAAAAGAPAAPAEATVDPGTRSGLSRRVPGRNLPSGATRAAPAEPGPADPTPVDPATARAEADAFTRGFARGVASVPGGATQPPETDGDGPTASWPGQATAPPQWPLSPPIPVQRPVPQAERIEGTPGEQHSDAADTVPVPPAAVPPAAVPPEAAAPTSAPPATMPTSAPPAAGQYPPAGAAPFPPERIEPVSGSPVSATPAGMPVSGAPVSAVPVSGAPVSSAPMSSAPVSPAPGDSDRYPLPPRRVPVDRTTVGFGPNGPAGARPPGFPEPARPAADGVTPQPATARGVARPQPAVARAGTGADDESTLTRRVPGQHLADELKVPGSVPAMSAGSARFSAGPAVAPGDRDPDTEQNELDALFAGFARGDAAVAGNGGSGRTGSTPNSGPAVQFPTQDPSPTFQFNSGSPNGAEPQNVERR